MCDAKCSPNREDLWVWLLLLITSIFWEISVELTSCPSISNHMPSASSLRINNLVFKLFGLCYVSGIVSLSLYLSSWKGVFQTCSCDVFPCSRSLSDAFASDLFLDIGNSIPRSLYDNYLVWIWCPLSNLLPAALKSVANTLSMFYRWLRIRL